MRPSVFAGIEHLRLRTTRDICHGSGAARLRIPSGTRVMVSPSLLHRHPRYWPAPAERPRASLYDTLLSAPDGVSSQGSGDGVQKDGCERCFLPFSSGPKGCIASQFALYEMRMLMMMTLRCVPSRFKFSACRCAEISAAASEERLCCCLPGVSSYTRFEGRRGGFASSTALRHPLL